MAPLVPRRHGSRWSLVLPLITLATSPAAKVSILSHPPWAWVGLVPEPPPISGSVIFSVTPIRLHLLTQQTLPDLIQPQAQQTQAQAHAHPSLIYENKGTWVGSSLPSHIKFRPGQVKMSPIRRDGVESEELEINIAGFSTGSSGGTGRDPFKRKRVSRQASPARIEKVVTEQGESNLAGK